MSFPVLCARLRVPLTAAGFLLVILGIVIDTSPRWLFGVAILLVGRLLYLRLGTVRREPIEVRTPMAGTWSAIHSPADHVPSHGLHAYGQTYAIDLVHEPLATPRPREPQATSPV